MAGTLSATFNIDGRHLERFAERRASTVRSLCDHLLLHDQILIPTQDYLTAAGLVRILGEHNVIALLEEERLHFVRLRGFFGYVRSLGPDGRLLGMNDPTGKMPNSSAVDQSIDMGLATIKGEYTEHNRLKNLLIDRSHELELGSVVDATHKDAYADLSQTSLWKDSYRFSNPDLLVLPGVKEMEVRVIGPSTDVTNNVIDACLALGLMNIELYLAKQFDCGSSSTGSPMGDCISLKIPRLTSDHSVPEKLWHFLDLAGVPDISGPLLADRGEMAKFLKLTRNRDADADGLAAAQRAWVPGGHRENEARFPAHIIEAQRRRSPLSHRNAARALIARQHRGNERTPRNATAIPPHQRSPSFRFDFKAPVPPIMDVVARDRYPMPPM
jgi:hypothetical protein